MGDPNMHNNRNPVAKNRIIEVNMAPPKIKKKAVNLLALLAFNCMDLLSS